MATKFADFDLATGNNDGSDWANAYRTLQAAHDGASAGDVVLCKGTDTLSQTVTFTNDGTYNGGYIKFIGVAASYSGTDPVAGNTGGSDRATINANGGAFPALTFNGASYIWMENFRITNAANVGVTYVTAYSDHNALLNCVADNCTTGWFGSSGYGRGIKFFRCCAHSNSVNGFYMRNADWFFCRAYANTGHGFNMYAGTVIGCVAHDNGGDGFYLYSSEMAVSCTAYGNTTDGFDFPLTGTAANTILGCRAAENGVGVNVSANIRAMLFYYYGDNTTETAGYYDEILNNGASTVTLNGTDTDEGFASPSTDDYNLTSSATYRRSAIVIP